MLTAYFCLCVYVLLSLLLVFISNIFVTLLTEMHAQFYMYLVSETVVVISFGEGFSSIVGSIVFAASLSLISDYSIWDFIFCLLCV